MDRELIKNKLIYLDEILRKIKRKYDLYKIEKDEENIDIVSELIVRIISNIKF